MKRSAGLLLHRRGPGGAVEVFLGHLGGPFFARKEAGAWSLVKGEHTLEEEPLAAARREWVEETGLPVPGGEPVPLGEVLQRGGKLVTVWAVAGDADPSSAVSGTFALEWPPRSGRLVDVPELDRFGWFTLARARELVVPAQVPFLERLDALTRRGRPG